MKTNVTKVSEVRFKNKTNFSNDTNFCIQTGVKLKYCSNREILYVFPMNTKGEHGKRWQGWSKEDIPKLIESLQEILKHAE